MTEAPAIPANVDVVFAASIEAARRIERPALVVTPDLGGWNDYGLKLYANLHILGDLVD